MAKFWIWQGAQYALVTQRSEYAKICLDGVLNISWVLDMPVFRIWQGSECSRVTQGSKYATIWWNMSEYDVNVIMSEFSITDRVPNMYPTKNRAKVTLRVNEDLLRDK